MDGGQPREAAGAAEAAAGQGQEAARALDPAQGALVELHALPGHPGGGEAAHGELNPAGQGLPQNVLRAGGLLGHAHRPDHREHDPRAQDVDRPDHPPAQLHGVRQRQGVQPGHQPDLAVRILLLYGLSHGHQRTQLLHEPQGLPRLHPQAQEAQHTRLRHTDLLLLPRLRRLLLGCRHSAAVRPTTHLRVALC